jgi:hypothetical protein
MATLPCALILAVGKPHQCLNSGFPKCTSPDFCLQLVAFALPFKQGREACLNQPIGARGNSGLIAVCRGSNTCLPCQFGDSIQQFFSSWPNTSTHQATCRFASSSLTAKRIVLWSHDFCSCSPHTGTSQIIYIPIMQHTLKGVTKVICSNAPKASGQDRTGQDRNELGRERERHTLATVERKCRFRSMDKRERNTVYVKYWASIGFNVITLTLLKGIQQCRRQVQARGEWIPTW